MYGGTCLPFSSRMLFSMPTSLNKNCAFLNSAAHAEQAFGYIAPLRGFRKKAGPSTSAVGGLAAWTTQANKQYAEPAKLGHEETVSQMWRRDLSY
jgi:hypothetical protein